MESIGSCVDRLFAVPGVNNLTCFLIREGIGPFLHILALLTLLSAAVLAPRVWLLLRQAPRSVWYDIAGLTALGFFLRWWLSPRCPQVFFDEVCYVQLADSLRACGRYCVEYEFPKREVIVPFLPAWPYWLSWLGRLGITEPAALMFV